MAPPRSEGPFLCPYRVANRKMAHSAPRHKSKHLLFRREQIILFETSPQLIAGFAVLITSSRQGDKPESRQVLRTEATPFPWVPCRTEQGRTQRHEEDLCGNFPWFCLRCFWLCRSWQPQQTPKWLSGWVLAPQLLTLPWITVRRPASGVITDTTPMPARLTDITAPTGSTAAPSSA